MIRKMMKNEIFPYIPVVPNIHEILTKTEKNWMKTFRKTRLDWSNFLEKNMSFPAAHI